MTMNAPAPAPEGLLPCPFCAASTDVVTGTARHAGDCWISLYFRDGQRGDRVVAAWNRRPTPPAQPAGVSTDAVLDIAEAAYWRNIDASTGRANRGRGEFRSALHAAITAAIAASKETT